MKSTRAQSNIFWLNEKPEQRRKMVEFVTYFLPHWKQQETNERFFFQLFSRCACLLVVWFNENHLEQRLEHELFFFWKKII